MIKRINLFACADILWDNNTVVTGGRYSNTEFWDLKTDTNTEAVWSSLYNGRAVQLKFSPTEKLLATGVEDGRLVLHDLTSLTSCLLCRYLGGILRITFSNDGTLLAVTTFDNKLSIWNVTTKTCVKKLTKQGLGDCSFSANDEFFAACFKKSFIKVWTIKRLKDSLKLIDKSNIYIKSAYSECITFSPTDNTLLASPSLIWNVETGKKVVKLQHGKIHAGSAAFSPNGDIVAIACIDNTVRLCYAKTGKCFETLDVYNCYHLKFSLNGHRLLTCSRDQHVSIWNVWNVKYFAEIAYILLRKSIADYVLINIINFLRSNINSIPFETESDYAISRKAVVISKLRQTLIKTTLVSLMRHVENFKT